MQGVGELDLDGTQSWWWARKPRARGSDQPSSAGLDTVLRTVLSHKVSPGGDNGGGAQRAGWRGGKVAERNATTLLDRDGFDHRWLWRGPSRLSEKLFDLPDLRGGRHLDGLRLGDPVMTSHRDRKSVV